MKIAIVSPKNRTVYNFRGDLIQDIVKLGHEVIVTGPNAIDVDKIKALGAHFIKIPLEKNGLNVLSDLQYLFRLKALFKREQIDIVFGYTIKPVIYGSIAARLAGVKHITAMVTGVGYLFTAKSIKARLLKQLALLLYRIGFACAHRVIFQNRDDRDEFLSYKILKPEKTVVVNGSGVNMDKFTPVPLPKTLTFFMLSRIMKSKGVAEYLKAAAIVKDKYPDVRFMLLGALENIQDSMTKEDLAPYIKMGAIEYFGETDNVAAYYAMTSVYVLPSYREGTPRTVLEAMAMKRPIITTNAPGCSGTVIDSKTGFLVEPEDSDGLAERMMWFIQNPKQIEPMGEAAYALCREKYDVKKVNQNMLKILKID